LAQFRCKEFDKLSFALCTVISNTRADLKSTSNRLRIDFESTSNRLQLNLESTSAQLRIDVG
jgi:hypothetical protein